MMRQSDGSRRKMGTNRDGITALMWISNAEWPLRADELYHAFAVQLGSTNFDVGNIPSMSTLVSCCQGFITVDREASTVRLIHFTVWEYLSSRPDIFSKPHSTKAEMYVTYLNSKQSQCPLDNPSSRYSEPALARILPGILGGAYKGAFRLRDITCARAIKRKLWPDIGTITFDISTVLTSLISELSLWVHWTTLRIILRNC